MPRGFAYWFGEIDLNEAAPEDAFGTSGEGTNGVGPSMAGGGPSSGVQTGVTLSSAESEGEEEVQSTPEEFVPKTPFVGMIFDSGGCGSYALQ